jgi:membrane-bound metal-dependent hydrolase YbcI (DUF457 family)
MTRATHTVTAVATALVTAQVTNIPPIELVCGALCTAMLPDIDHEYKSLRHRGQTHSIIWTIMLLVCAYIAPSGNYIILGGAIGWFSHIAIDLFNGKGIEIFYPLTDKNYRLADIKYNGRGEKWIRYIMMLTGVVSIIGLEKITIIAKEVIK